MNKITELKRPQVIEQDVIDEIRAMLVRAEQGEVTDVVFAACLRDEGNYYRTSDFGDCWRLLGCLEYAKNCVLKAVGTAA